MTGRRHDPLPFEGRGRTLSRRELLALGARLGVSVPTAAALLAACGNDSSTTPGDESASESAGTGSASPAAVTGEMVLLNYVGWIGENEVDAFEAAYPETNIKQAPDNSTSIGGKVQIIKNNSTQYDATLGDEAFVEQALLADIIEEVDFANIPNIENVSQDFRDAYPHGIPTDYGKVGIAYRKDLVSETITGWADLWALAPKYSGQLMMIDLDRDTMGAAMKYLGYSGNSTNLDEIAKARDALIEIKPHLLALKYYNVAAPLVSGSAVMALAWDFDVAINQQKESNIEWVFPEEGTVAYLEGWVAVKDTPNKALVEAFMNWHLDPEQYADFVNTTGTAYVAPASTPYIKKSISENPILFPDEATLAEVEFEKFLGEATADWAKAWDEFKSA
jgi:spermidine/putrescine transport system substrate-binding protein